MPLSYPALKTELNTDPNAYGYAAHVAAGNDQVLADMLNWLRDGATAPPVGATGAAISVKRPDIQTQELLEAIDIRDFVTPVPGVPNLTLAASWFESVTQQRSMRLITDAGVDTRVKTNLDRMLGNGQQSQTRLNAIAVKVGSRAEALFGSGVTVNSSDIAQALRATP